MERSSRQRRHHDQTPALGLRQLWRPEDDHQAVTREAITKIIQSFTPFELETSEKDDPFLSLRASLKEATKNYTPEKAISKPISVSQSVVDFCNAAQQRRKKAMIKSPAQEILERPIEDPCRHFIQPMETMLTSKAIKKTIDLSRGKGILPSKLSQFRVGGKGEFAILEKVVIPPMEEQTDHFKLLKWQMQCTDTEKQRITAMLEKRKEWLKPQMDIAKGATADHPLLAKQLAAGEEIFKSISQTEDQPMLQAWQCESQLANPDDLSNVADLSCPRIPAHGSMTHNDHDKIVNKGYIGKDLDMSIKPEGMIGNMTLDEIAPSYPSQQDRCHDPDNSNEILVPTPISSPTTGQLRTRWSLENNLMSPSLSVIQPLVATSTPGGDQDWDESTESVFKEYLNPSAFRQSPEIEHQVGVAEREILDLHSRYSINGQLESTGEPDVPRKLQPVRRRVIPPQEIAPKQGDEPRSHIIPQKRGSDPVQEYRHGRGPSARITQSLQGLINNHIGRTNTEGGKLASNNYGEAANPFTLDGLLDLSQRQDLKSIQHESQSTRPSPKTGNEMSSDWTGNSSVRNPRWYSNACRPNPQKSETPLPILVAMSVLQNLPFFRALKTEGFEIVEREKKMHNTDMVISPFTAMILRDIRTLAKTAMDLLQELKIAAQRFRRIVVVIECISYMAYEKDENISKKINPLNDSTIQAIERIRDLLPRALASAGGPVGEVELVFAYNGAKEVTRVIRWLIADDGRESRKVDHVRYKEIYEDRLWLSREPNERELQILTVEFELNIFCAWYALAHCGSLEGLIGMHDAQRKKSFDGVIGGDVVDRLNAVLAKHK
ncbi:uncharacterized protein I303_105103 [Kwoniella dejecticola CBS 10117]|uniref:Uncharacterized protein n=1 Tax=Kwoniella dejecticola CBS 10117 TaxID=1296121 RepID=A0A1A6A3F5_9TREE|nr:uncharacterized protein I303_05452 [Kwoniella dejecticola CBS 10117]OBR84593.1 hypothetical protein I303_05452 [Kwoniella dejecticola CBS 10117]